MAKLKNLQEQIDFGERSKMDLRDKLLKTEELNKDLVGFIKTL